MNGRGILAYKESQRDTRRPALFGGMNPPDERKEGDANDYIFRTFSVLHVHCRSRGIVLYNLREKKIAATTPNSDGWPRKR